jgi:heat shock protein HtpX
MDHARSVNDGCNRAFEVFQKVHPDTKTHPRVIHRTSQRAWLPPFLFIFLGWRQRLNLCVREVTWVLSRFLPTVALQNHLWQSNCNTSHASKGYFISTVGRESGMNQIKVVMLLSLLTALMLWIGQALAGQSGLIMALIFAGIMNLCTYWFSDRMVLRMYGAKEMSKTNAPGLHAIVHEIATRGGLPTPKLYLIPEEAPNAFATGRNPAHSSVAVTEGLIRMLTINELAGVIAHELGHIKNRDTLIMTIAATFAGALSMIANMAMWGSFWGGSGSSDDEDRGTSPLAGLLGILIAPIAAMLIQTSISRSREFLADEAGARLSRNPLALASALRNISSYIQTTAKPLGSPATAHLCIINPFSGGGLSRLFSTHPPTEARIARLEELAIRGV